MHLPVVISSRAACCDTGSSCMQQIHVALQASYALFEVSIRIFGPAAAVPCEDLLTSRS